MKFFWKKKSEKPRDFTASRVDEDLSLKVARGVWGSLARMPEPALLFSGRNFKVIAQNDAAQRFFESDSADIVTKLLERSLSKLLVDRVCLATVSSSGAYVSELSAQITLSSFQVKLVRLTVLPIPGPNNGPRVAVLYLRKIEKEQHTESFAKLPRELLSWLPMPAWLVDDQNQVPYQNSACHEMPSAALVGAQGPDIGTVLTTDVNVLEIVSEFDDALRKTALVARKDHKISDALVMADGQLWRLIHLPVTGLDAKFYLLGLAVRVSNDLDGAKFDIQREAGSDCVDRQRKLQVQARERERVKLAREVHDSLGQELTVLRLGLDRLFSAFQEELPINGPQLAQIHHTKEQMEQVIKSARTIALQLRNDLVDSAGLLTAVDQLVAQFRQKLGVPGQIEVSSGWVAPPRVLAGNIYRSIQELLNNLAKHAKASKFVVRLFYVDGDYQLEVRDDGVGMKIDRNPPSLGLRALRERVESHNGSLRIKTRPEVDGTYISLTFLGEQPPDFPDTVS